MSVLYPFSATTAARLTAGPAQGSTHAWLAQIAAGLAHAYSREDCERFLRRACDVFVAHRKVPDREIVGAIEFAFAGGPPAPCAEDYGRRTHEWPDACPALIRRVLDTTPPLFDATADTGLRAADVLPGLFEAGELVCAGATSDRPSVRPLDATLTDAHACQFVVPNPMRGPQAVSHAGKLSARCQNNVALRRYLVAEFDDASLTKPHQARLIGALGGCARVALVVDSGGKSLHAWLDVAAMPRADQVRLFQRACLLGADPTRWDICGWVRMPGGTRAGGAAQRVVFWGYDGHD